MSPRDALEVVYRGERARVLATLIRLGRDFELAEEALHDAVASAIPAWERDGTPDNPGAWLTTAARRKLLDRIRARKTTELPAEAPAQPIGSNDDAMPDDRLRLVFTCCHPALALEARIALTLNAVVGLTAAEIARAFLLSEDTLAQRLVRAKRKIRDAAIRYEVPTREERAERLDAVLSVLYLVFNEGHVATRGEELARLDLCEEALRWASLLSESMPDEPEIRGLFALFAFQHARRDARTADDGSLVTLERQDRSRFDGEAIARGRNALRSAAAQGRVGRYQIEAAIAAEHTVPRDVTATDWPRIVRLYDRLLEFVASPVVSLNRAIALSRAEGAPRGLRAVDDANRDGALDDYPYFHAARGEMLAKLLDAPSAAAAFERAASLTKNAIERRFLEARAREARGTS